MLNDYKGETPDNVITKEQHEKRPFYKKVSFWVLSALGLFFGGCSVYGLVLGYQYVHAVTEAAHIIADANASSEDDDLRPLNAVRRNAVVDAGNEVASFNLGVKYWDWVNASASSAGRWITTFTGFDAPSNIYLAGHFFCDYYETCPWNQITNLNYDKTIAVLRSGGVNYIGIHDDSTANMTPVEFKSYLNGKYIYFYPNADWTGTDIYDKGVQEGYDSGYDEGYAEGHQDGYQEGYDDGYQALAGVQNVRILFDENFPTLNPVNYSWKVDGTDVASGQIMLRPNQSVPVVNLTRPGGYTHTATLNIWSENDEPLVIAYGRHEGLVVGGTQTYIYDTYNKSNAYDWANSVWYVPTYNPNTGFLIYSYGTAQQGYTNDYFFEFDPEHNDRAKTGIYADGYDQGYKDGTESGTAYDNGYGAGYDQGYDDGMTIGKAQGEAQAVGGQKALVTMFVTAFQQPFDQIYRFLNFNVLGLNILALFTALLTLSIGIIIIKKVI